MQIRPTSVRLVRLNFGLSLYLDRTFGLSLSLSRNFGLRPKFRLSERLSEITSLFDLSLVLDRTLAQRKAKSKSEFAHYASKNGQNMGRGHQILTPNELTLTFWAPNDSAKFHQN